MSSGARDDPGSPRAAHRAPTTGRGGRTAKAKEEPIAAHAWRYGPGWGYYHSEVDVDRDKVTEATKGLLAKAKTGDAWTDPQGGTHIPVLVDDEVVGMVWVDM